MSGEGSDSNHQRHLPWAPDEIEVLQTSNAAGTRPSIKTATLRQAISEMRHEPARGLGGDYGNGAGGNDVSAAALAPNHEWRVGDDTQSRQRRRHCRRGDGPATNGCSPAQATSRPASASSVLGAQTKCSDPLTLIGNEHRNNIRQKNEVQKPSAARRKRFTLFGIGGFDYWTAPRLRTLIGGRRDAYIVRTTLSAPNIDNHSGSAPPSTRARIRGVFRPGRPARAGGAFRTVRRGRCR